MIEKWVCDACRTWNSQTETACIVCKAPRPACPEIRKIYAGGRCPPEERAEVYAEKPSETDAAASASRRSKPKPFEGDH